MLYSTVGRLATKWVARSALRCPVSETRVLYRSGSARFLATSSIRRSSDVATSAVTGIAAPTVEKITPIASTVNETAVEKIVDISGASDVTISQIAEGLSSDLIAAGGVVPTLQDMGLGSYFTPAGLVQNALYFLHTAGLPWWLAIATSTLVIKTLVFPLVIKARRNSVIMNNTMPEMQRLQMKVTEARQCGNALESTRAACELVKFQEEKGFNPFKSVLPMIVQAPIFISFFVGLRGMANLPVESMKTGGIYWFTDLTVPDPHYILPAVTCVTLLIILEVGADGQVRSDTLKKTRHVLRAIPFVVFYFIYDFPAAMVCYWTTSNFISLAQHLLLLPPAMRKRFNIPELMKHEKQDLPLTKGFVQDFKDGYTNMKLSNEVNRRANSDELRFRRAGAGPIVKTFKHPKKVGYIGKN